EQLTDIGSGREEPKPADPKTSQGVLQIQEKELLAAVGDRVRRREADEAERKRDHPRKPFKLEERQTVQHLQLCPDEKCVIGMFEDGAKGDKPDNVPNYVTESGYTAVINGRTNVGDNQENWRAAVISVETGEVKWVDAGLGERSVWHSTPVFNE